MIGENSPENKNKLSDQGDKLLGEKEIQSSASNWAIIGGSLSFILLMLFSWKRGYDMTSAKIMMLAMILGQRLYVSQKSWKSLNLSWKLINILLILGLSLLVIGELVSILSI